MSENNATVTENKKHRMAMTVGYADGRSMPAELYLKLKANRHAPYKRDDRPWAPLRPPIRQHQQTTSYWCILM